MFRLRPGVVQRGFDGRALRGLRRPAAGDDGGCRGAGRGMSGGRHFRAALPPERWEAASLFLRSLAARRGCGRVRVNDFIREYRSGRLGNGQGGGGEVDR